MKKQKKGLLFTPYLVPALLILAGVGFWFVLNKHVDPVLNFASDMWTYICYAGIVLVAVLAGLSVLQVRAQGMAAFRVVNIPLAVLYFLAGLAGVAYGAVNMIYGINPLSIYNILQGILFVVYGIWMAIIGVLFCTQKKPSPTKSPILGFWAVMPFCVQAAVRVLRAPASLFRLLPTVRLLAALLAVLWLATLVRGFYIALHRRRMRTLYVQGMILFLVAFCLEMVQVVYAAVTGTFELLPLLESVNMGALGLAACGTSLWVAACSRKDLQGGVQVEDMLMEEGPIKLVERSVDEKPITGDEAMPDGAPKPKHDEKLPLVAASGKGDSPTLTLSVQDILAQDTKGDSPTMVLDARLLRGEEPLEETKAVPQEQPKQAEMLMQSESPTEGSLGNQFKGELLTPAPAESTTEGTAEPFVAQKLTPTHSEEVSAMQEDVYGMPDSPKAEIYPTTLFGASEEQSAPVQSSPQTANLFAADEEQFIPMQSPAQTGSLFAADEEQFIPMQSPAQTGNLFAADEEQFIPMQSPAQTGNLLEADEEQSGTLSAPPRPVNLFEEAAFSLAQTSEEPAVNQPPSFAESPMTPMYAPLYPQKHHDVYKPHDSAHMTGNLFDEGTLTYSPKQEQPQPVNLFAEQPSDTQVDLFDESVLEPSETFAESSTKAGPSLFDQNPPAGTPISTNLVQNEAEEDMWDATAVLDAEDHNVPLPIVQAEPAAPAASIFEQPVATPYQYEEPAAPAYEAEPIAPAASIFEQPAATPYQYEEPAAPSYEAEPVVPAASIFEQPAPAPYQYEAPAAPAYEAEPVVPAASIFEQPAPTPYQYEEPVAPAYEAEPIAPAASIFEQPAATPYQYEAPAAPAYEAEPVAPAASIFEQPVVTPYQYEEPVAPAYEAESVVPAASIFEQPVVAPYQYEEPAASAYEAEPVAPAASIFEQPAATPYQYEAPAAPAYEAEPVAPAASIFEQPAVTPYQYEEPAAPAYEAEPVAPAASIFEQPAATPYQYEEQAAPAYEAEPVAPAASIFEQPAATPYQYEAPAAPAYEAEPVVPAASIFEQPAATPYQYEEQAAPSYEAEPVAPAASAFEQAAAMPYQYEEPAAPSYEAEPVAPVHAGMAHPQMAQNSLFDSGNVAPYDNQLQYSSPIQEQPQQGAVYYDARPQPAGQLYGSPQAVEQAPPIPAQEPAALGRTMNMAVEEILAELKSSTRLPDLDAPPSAKSRPSQQQEGGKVIFKRK